MIDVALASVSFTNVPDGAGGGTVTTSTWTDATVTASAGLSLDCADGNPSECAALTISGDADSKIVNEDTMSVSRVSPAIIGIAFEVASANQVWELVPHVGITGNAYTGFTFEDFKMQKPSVSVILTLADSIRLEYDFALQRAK